MIYLDNSATTRQYDEVTDAMTEAMRNHFGNPSSLYQLGVDAERAIKAARRQVLDAAGAGGAKFGSETWDVVFTSGGTEADNMAIFGAARALRRSGKRIVTTAVEHPAVLECCRRLEQDGFEVVCVGVDENGFPDMEQMREVIDDQTILVTMMHVNNEVGTVMPAGEIKNIMNEKGAPGFFHCDAVQSFGKMPLPQDADLISISGHKIHGPKGSGALLINKSSRSGVKASQGGGAKASNIPAFILGGGQESGRRSGTENVPAIIGLGEAARIAAADGAGYRSIAEMAQIRQALLEGLCDRIEDIEINSPAEAGIEPGQCCPGVLNINFAGTRGEVVLHTLEQEGIYVSTGSACSSNKKGQSHVLQAMGRSPKQIEGAIRFSLGRLNHMDEVEQVVDAAAKAVTRFRRLGSFR